MKVVNKRLVDNDLALGIYQSKLATVVPRDLTFVHRLLRKTVFLRVDSAMLAFNEFC